MTSPTSQIRTHVDAITLLEAEDILSHLFNHPSDVKTEDTWQLGKMPRSFAAGDVVCVWHDTTCFDFDETSSSFVCRSSLALEFNFGLPEIMSSFSSLGFYFLVIILVINSSVSTHAYDMSSDMVPQNNIGNQVIFLLTILP